MNKFKNFFLGTVIIFSLSTVAMLAILQNNQLCLIFENILSNVSLVLNRTDICSLKLEFLNNINAMSVKIYSLKGYVCMLFNDVVVQYDYCRILSLGELKKKVIDNRNFLVNKLMYQSNLLNSEYTILELGAGKNTQVYWVIQLGALRNFQKVLEVVDKLKVCNYPVYILPDYVQDGDLVRIFVGPYSSKEHLKSLIDELYHLSMLRGEIYLY